MVTQLNPNVDFAATLAPQMNILTNGGFEVWQRNTTFSSPADESYTADRWKLSRSGTPTFTVSQSSTVDSIGSYSAAVAISSVGSGGTLSLYQSIDYYKNHRGQTLSLSIRVKTTIANSIKAYIYDGVNITYSSFHTGSGNWETLTATQVIGASTSLLYFGVGFVAGGGAALTTGTFYVDNAMAAASSVPVSFIQMHPTDDLQRCLRYYEATNPDYSNTVPIIRSGSANLVAYYTVQFIAPKAAAPTITLSNTQLYMYHLPTTGNGSSGNDTANWTLATTTSGLRSWYWRFTRNTDQTVYPVLNVDFAWTAEVT